MRYLDTDHDWELFGQLDPYWAVVAADCFRKENVNEQTLREFFDWGERHIAWVLETVHSYLDSRFAPRSALDFGCGVGRLLLPLARRCQSAVGVDVADSMLQRVQAHCADAGLTNVTLVKSDDDLSAVTGPFDLVNSHIVLQHIPCPRGYQLFRRLVELIWDGDVRVLHVTYSKEHLEAVEPSVGLPAPSAPAARVPDGFWHHLAGLRRAVRRQLAQALGRTARPAPPPPTPAPVVASTQMPTMLMN